MSIRNYLFIIILTMVLSTASGWSKPVAEPILLTNASFEEGEFFPGTMFPGWHGYSTDKSLFALTGEAKKTGERCAKFAAQQSGSQFQGLTQSMVIDSSQKYTFSVYVISCAASPLKGTAHGQLVVEWLGSDGSEIDRVWTESWGQSLSRKQWKQFRIKKITPPKDAVQAIVGVHLFEGKSGGTGAVYVDDITAVAH